MTQVLPVGCTHLPELFGEPGRRVMSYFHPPRAKATGRVVVLCSPIGHEHIRCQKTFFRLADQLARAGFGVLRFDCLGMGDSSLESHEVRLEDWVWCVEQACARALELSGARFLDYVSLRLGATLGVLASGSGRAAIDRLVLWQPVSSGRALVEELGTSHEQFTVELGARRPSPDDEPREFMGYRYSQAMLRDLEGLDLGTRADVRAREVVVLDTTEPPSCGGIATALDGPDRAVRHVKQPDDAVWLAEPYKEVMPHESIRAIMEYLTGRAS